MRRLRLVLGTILIGSAMIAARWCGAQPRHEVSLDEAIALAGTGNYLVHEARAVRAAAEAEWLLARSAFDWSTRVAVLGEYLDLPGGSAFPGGGRVAMNRVYEASVGRVIPSGIRIEPFVRASRGPGFGGADENTLAVGGIALRLPLMQVGRSHPASKQVHAAERRIRATEFRQLHDLSEQLQQVASAYWDAVEAEMRVEILAAAETRAQDLLGMIQRLAMAGERPRAEVRQMEAYLADRVASRIGSEHQRFVAMERLKVLLGITGHTVEGRPVQRWLPEPDTFALPPAEADFTATADQRWDLRAAREEQAAASELVYGARAAARPQFDLELATTQTISGAASDARARGSRTVTVGLSLGRSIPNRAGIGVVAQRQSIEKQQTLRLEALRQQAEAAIRIAGDAVDTAEREVLSADAARAAHELSVEQEFVRLSNGFATVLDVTVAEERLTSAQLSALAARARYARALARDAHEQGRIVRAEEELPAERSARLLSR